MEEVCEVGTVRGQRGTGRSHTGCCGQRPDSKVTGSEWWGRPMGASIVPSHLLGVCLHPGLGGLVPSGGNLKLLSGGKGRSELAVGTPCVT